MIKKHPQLNGKTVGSLIGKIRRDLILFIAYVAKIEIIRNHPTESSLDFDSIYAFSQGYLRYGKSSPICTNIGRFISPVTYSK